MKRSDVARALGVLLPGLLAVHAAGQLPPVPSDSADDAEKPKLVVTTRFQDLGTMTEGDTRAVSWVLENHGTADLVIESTKPSCGCTVVQLADDQRKIPPGGSLELKSSFDSRLRRGPQSNYVMVHTNDPLEPQLRLEFKVVVEPLVEVVPGGLVNLQGIQRGERATRPVEIIRAESRKSLELIGIDVYEGHPVEYEVEPFEEGNRTGYRIWVTIPADAPLGTLSTKLRVKLRIDEFERERIIPLRGEIAGDLTWQPQIIDVTRFDSQRGMRLKPVTIRSTDKRPFQILGVSAGPLLSAACEPVESVRRATQYYCHVTIGEEAPTGPFGATLAVRTDLLDQPVVHVPVFAIVPPIVAVEPPVILFRQDGTPVGTQRLVKLQASAQTSLEILEVKSGLSAVTASVNQERSRPYRHLRYLDVTLSDQLPKGTHETVLTVKTTVERAEELDIPVTIQVP